LSYWDILRGRMLTSHVRFVMPAA